MYDDAKKLSEEIQKDSTLKNPFEDTRKIFNCSNQMYFNQHQPDLAEKLELFFNDYTFMPSFVFENYLSAEPPSKRRKAHTKNPFRHHAQVSAALSAQDVMASIRMSSQSWSLLQSEGQLSVVYPGRMLCGGLSYNPSGAWSGGVNFPAVFGKTSNKNKNNKLCSDIQQHTGRNLLCASRSTFEMFYLSSLSKLLVKPLLISPPEIEKAVKLCLDYDLVIEDFAAIQELSVWDKHNSSVAQKEKMTRYSKVDSKTKGAFTRLFKKLAAEHQYPFASENLAAVRKIAAKKTAKITESDGSDSEAEEDIDASAFSSKSKAKAAPKKAAAKSKKAKK